MKKEYKNLKVNKENVKKSLGWRKFVLIGGLAALLFFLSGCQDDRILATNSEAVYDVIDTTDETLVKEGIEQVLDVPNEEFKLKVNYKCILAENAKWTVTGDKQIYSEISTVGLPEDYEVYVDNVHSDTTIRSIYPTIDGITQDTMDDRLHAGQLLGFPISDTNSYGNINSIEGQNETFISATYYGYVGASAHLNTTTSESRSVSSTYVHLDQRRRTESEYLLGGVYANKIDSVIDLIIVKPKKITVATIANVDGTITEKPLNSLTDVEKKLALKDKDGNIITKEVNEVDENGNVVKIQECTSVNSAVEVSVWPYVTYKDSINRTCHIYYFIDKNTGKISHEDLSDDQYKERLEQSKVKVKTK